MCGIIGISYFLTNYISLVQVFHAFCTCNICLFNESLQPIRDNMIMIIKIIIIIIIIILSLSLLLSVLLLLLLLLSLFLL